MVVLFSQGGGGSFISRSIIGSYILEQCLVFIGTWKKVCIVSSWSCFVTLTAWLKLAPAVLISAMLLALKVPVGVLSVALFGHLQVHVGPYGDTLGDRDIFHALLNVCRYKFGILIHIYMPTVGCSGLEHVPDL